MPAAHLRSIGQVLTILKSEFPDVSISKIRFLEGEGLVSPERAPSGYRRYAEVDIDRLRYILRMQRDYYLPLKVIREHLDVMDHGGAPPAVDTPTSVLPSVVPEAVAARGLEPADTNSAPPRAVIRLTRRELIKASGLPEATLIELERQQMVLPRRGSMYYGREALTLCVVARKLQSYGMDTRHLRAIKQSAEREAGLVEQAAQPFMRTVQGDAVHEISQLVMHAHAALIYTLLER